MQEPKVWGGGRSPFNVSYGKMMMWIFLLSDIVMFAAFFAAFAVFFARFLQEQDEGDGEIEP